MMWEELKERLDKIAARKVASEGTCATCKQPGPVTNMNARGPQCGPCYKELAKPPKRTIMDSQRYTGDGAFGDTTTPDY